MTTNQLIAAIALVVLALCVAPAAAKHWRRLVVVFFVWLTFEGLVRRAMPGIHQWLFLAKDVVLLPILVGAARELRAANPRLPSALLIATGLYFIFHIAHVIAVGSIGFVPILIGLKLNFLYLAFVPIGAAFVLADQNYLGLFRRLWWMSLAVLLVAFLQIATGWQVADADVENLQGLRDSEGASVIAGGRLRNNADGTKVYHIASTFYGGRLAPFGMIWVLVGLSLVAFQRTGAGTLRPMLIVIAATANLLLGTIRTAALATGGACIGIFLIRLLARPRPALHRLILPPLAAVSGVMLLVFLTPSTAILSPTELQTFFGAVLQRDAYDVVGTSLWSALETSRRELGFWGIGIGAMSQGVAYWDDAVVPRLELQVGVDSQALRLMIETGVLGLLGFLVVHVTALAGMLGKAFDARATLEMKQTHALAISLMLGWLVLGYKGAGFSTDPLLQSYVYFTLGCSLGVGQRLPVSTATARKTWAVPRIEAAPRIALAFSDEAPPIAEPKGSWSTRRFTGRAGLS